MPHKPRRRTDDGIRCCALVRVSTDEQAEEGHSPQTQIARIQRYAQDRWGFELADEDIYLELGVSGRNELAKRPGLMKILAACESGKYTHFLVHKMDRLGRNLGVMYTVMQRVEAAGVVFISVHDNTDVKTAEGRMKTSIVSIFAQYFSDNQSDESKKGHEGRRRAGNANGFPAFGAMRDPQSGLVIPDRRPIMLRDGIESTRYDGLLLVCEMVANRKSPADIAQHMVNLGYTTDRGKAPFSRGVVRRLQVNRFLLGEIPDGDGGWLPGRHQPLITTELWERMQAAMLRNQINPQSIPHTAHSYPLGGGIMRCHQCYEQGISSALYGRVKFGKRGYFCRSRHERKSCAEPYTPAHKLESQMGWVLEQFHLSTDDRVRLLELYAQKYAKPPKQTNLKFKIQSLEKRIENNKLLFELGDKSKEEFLSTRQRLLQELAEARGQDKQQATPERILDLAEYLDHAADAWKDAEDEERHDMSRLIFKEIWVRDQRIIAIRPIEEFQPMFHLEQDMGRLGCW